MTIGDKLTKNFSMPEPRTIPAEVPQLHFTQAMAAARPALWHSGTTLSRFHLLLLQGALLPIAAGALLYGWRTLMLVALVVGSAAVVIPLWRRIGGRGPQLRTANILWLALLLALMLPVHLLTHEPPFDGGPLAQWAILCGAGVLVVLCSWILTTIGAARIHPAVVAYLLLVVLFKQTLIPHWVLRSNRLFVGDITHAERSELAITATAGWTKTPSMTGQDALYEDAVS